MKEEDKYGKNDLKDFLRYTNGKMTDREKNDFERELQKDAFAADAAEGFSEISSENAEKDLARLERQLKSRTSRRQRFVFYRIAASVAVLMIISSVFLIVNREEKPKEIENLSAKQVTMDIPESKAIKVDQIRNKDERKASLSEVAREKAEYNEKKEPYMLYTHEEKPTIAGIKNVPDAVVISEEAEQVILAYNAAVSEAPVSRQKVNGVTVRGKVISTEDNMPIPGATVVVKGTMVGALTDTGGNFQITTPDKSDSVLVAGYIGMKSKEFLAKDDRQMQINMEPDEVSLNEVVVVGYGISKSSKTTGIGNEAYNANYQETGYTPPLPVDGKNNFDKYIEDNIRIPGALATGEKAVVVISFIVKINCEIDSIKILRSPGDEFSAEAKRLIIQGPQWNPATSNGEKIDDEVRIRIVFK
jgi:hypothetical protein